MILISESCGRQRVSLKPELLSTTQVLLYRRIRISVLKTTEREYFTSLLHVSPKCNISQPMDYFDFLNV